MGYTAKPISGDVTRLEDVGRAISAVSVIFSRELCRWFMAVANKNFTKMSFVEWVTAPKIQVSWNFRNASMAAELDLDFFWMFIPVPGIGIVGQAGQANYVCGSSFLDSFAQYRNGLGLGASVVGIGAVEEVCWISEHSQLESSPVSKIPSSNQEHLLCFSRCVGHRRYGGYRGNGDSAATALHHLAVHSLREASDLLSLAKHSAECASLTNIQKICSQVAFDAADRPTHVICIEYSGCN